MIENKMWKIPLTILFFGLGLFKPIKIIKERFREKKKKKEPSTCNFFAQLRLIESNLLKNPYTAFHLHANLPREAICLIYSVQYMDTHKLVLLNALSLFREPTQFSFKMIDLLGVNT